jgi:hypothetical protein
MHVDMQCMHPYIQRGKSRTRLALLKLAAEDVGIERSGRALLRLEGKGFALYNDQGSFFLKLTPSL